MAIVGDKKYSVLMSVYYKENPEYFRLSIESMLNQTLKPDEIVIVKDGLLTDQLNEIIDYYTLNYPDLFTIVPLERNVGLGLALNVGLKFCRNDLVARMDTDDISLQQRCELQVNEFLKDRQLSICGTMIDEFYNNPENVITSRLVPTEHEEIFKFSKRRSPFNHPTVMFKKSEVLRCGGYRDIERKEDFDLFVRMLNNGCKAMNIDKSLLLFRANEGNYERRKSWVNCKNSIKVMYDFWKKGYSSTMDLIVVTLGHIIVYILPIPLLKIFSDNLLRKKVRDDSSLSCW